MLDDEMMTDLKRITRAIARARGTRDGCRGDVMDAVLRKREAVSNE